MKRIAVLIVLSLIFTASFAQKKNGTVYSEHKSIDMTRALWKAFQVSDAATYQSFFADSIMIVRNGRDWKTSNADFAKGLNWWKNNIENLSVKDFPGAYPDAIEYADGNLWVQDWLLITGTHKSSGINLELEMHNMYAIDKDGKVKTFIQYYNNNVFEDINVAQTTQENGKVYIGHPYIATVRKLVNAYAAEDLKTMLQYYAENAQFSTIEQDWDKSIDLETRKKGIQQNFDNAKDIHFKQIGYPDCIYYEKNDAYEVYSWWEYSFTMEDSGKKVVMPLMLSHSFNKDGKIVAETAYYSTNHFED
jgi:ketosteroid isomerase-like protein